MSRTYASVGAFTRAVDAILLDRVGLSSSCLADWGYWDAWDDGMEPVLAAHDVMQWNDYPDDLLVETFPEAYV